MRFLAKDEADLSPPRYPIFGAVYWFCGWLGITMMNLGLWVLIPLWLITALALYHFFFVTMAKSLWLAAVFVVLRTAASMAWVWGLNALMESTTG